MNDLKLESNIYEEKPNMPTLIPKKPIINSSIKNIAVLIDTCMDKVDELSDKVDTCMNNQDKIIEMIAKLDAKLQEFE